MVRKAFIILFLIFTSVFLSGCSLKKAPAALQINTTPVANVFIEGKLLGKTPFSESNFKAGEVLLKLIPEATTQPLVSWEGKVKLTSGVLTLIDREFAPTEGGSSGQILTLERLKEKKTASILVISDPDGALVKINNETKGFAPLAMDKVNEGEYEILISKEGFAERTVKAKVANGYRLVVSAKLAEGGGVKTPTGETSKDKSTKTEEMVKPYVLIKETPTGWLRVRMGPSTNATEAAKVKPGEKYSLLEDKAGWYKIRYSIDKEGWISGQYATKFE